MAVAWLFLVPVLIYALYLIRKYFAGGVCKCTTRLDSKVVIVTGGSRGIGKEVARNMASRGATVIVTSRSKQAAVDCSKELQEKTGNAKIHGYSLDLSSLESVQNFVLQFKKDFGQLDILINNAGIFAAPYSLTGDNIEIVFQTNYLGMRPIKPQKTAETKTGHFLLTMSVMDLLQSSAPSRIVNVSSAAYSWCKPEYAVWQMPKINSKDGYTFTQAYGRSKLAQVLFTHELHQRYSRLNVYSFVVHPGVVDTEILDGSTELFPGFRFLKLITWPVGRYFVKNPNQGAYPVVHCAVAPHLEANSGKFFWDCKPVALRTPLAEDKDSAARLWSQSLKWIKSTAGDGN